LLLALGLSRVLEDPEDYELCRSNRCDTDFANQSPVQNVVLSHGCAVAGYEEGFLFSSTEERATSPL